jgi:hypothetical protein
MTMFEPELAGALFFHPENITVGHGRILYVKAGVCSDGVWRPDGYAMPGGLRTTSRQHALAVAAEIDRLTTEAEKREAARPPAIVPGAATWP